MRGQGRDTREYLQDCVGGNSPLSTSAGKPNNLRLTHKRAPLSILSRQDFLKGVMTVICKNDVVLMALIDF